jgi:hypothetical protein
MLGIMFRPFGLLAPKDFKIVWLYNILTAIPDEYYSKNVSIRMFFSMGMGDVPIYVNVYIIDILLCARRYTN